jgi:hypothetical protein
MKWLDLDLRSIAVFRIGLGLCLFLDCLDRIKYYGAFHADSGLVPRQLALDSLVGDVFRPLDLLMTGVPPWIPLISLTLASIGIIVGWRSTLFCVVAWFLNTYLQRTNPFILHTGDDLLGAFLLWSMFLPLGQRFSVDGLKSERLHHSTKLIGFVFALQMFFVLTVGAWQKDFHHWVVAGDAVHRAISYDLATVPMVHFLLDYPGLLGFLSRMSWLIEVLGGLLLLIPFAPHRLRLLAILLTVPLLVGIQVAMDVGHFPLLAAIGMLLFLPDQVWSDSLKTRKLDQQLTGRPSQRFHDGVLAVLAVFVLFWNLADKQDALPPWLKSLGHGLVIDQGWRMFAPKPSVQDGWYLVSGYKSDGVIIDLWRGAEELDLTKPSHIPEYMKSFRFRRYFTNLNSPHRTQLGPSAVQYFCSHTSDFGAVESVQIDFMLEETMGPGEDPKPIRRQPILLKTCSF